MLSCRANAGHDSRLMSNPISQRSPSLIVSYVTQRDVKGELSLALDAGPPCSFRLEGTDGLNDVCTLPLPDGAQEISITGELSYLPYREKSLRKEARGTWRWPIVDLSPMIGILRDTRKPFGQRLCEFEASAHLFQQIATGPAKDVLFYLKLERPVPAAEVASAERRLGFALPAEHVSLLLEVGRLSFGDTYSTRVAELDNAYDYMIENRWVEKTWMEKHLPPQTAWLLKTSTILFEEAGDGLSGLLYQPAREAGQGGQDAYFWISQGSPDDPTLLQKGDGSCRSYTEAMIWLTLRESLMYEGDRSDLEIALVDRSSPVPSRLRLWHEEEFVFSLNPAWEFADKAANLFE